jgi:hypothetical protein
MSIAQSRTCILTAVALLLPSVPAATDVVTEWNRKVHASVLEAKISIRRHARDGHRSHRHVRCYQLNWGTLHTLQVRSIRCCC